MRSIGNDGGASGQVARHGLPRGQADVGGKAQPENPHAVLAGGERAAVVVVVGMAQVPPPGDIVVAAERRVSKVGTEVLSDHATVTEDPVGVRRCSRDGGSVDGAA